MSSAAAPPNASPASFFRSRLVYLAIVAGAATLPNPARAAVETTVEHEAEAAAPQSVSAAEQPTGKLAFVLEPGENGARTLLLTSEAGTRLPLADIDALWSCALGGHLDSDGAQSVTVSCGDEAVEATLYGPATAKRRARDPEEEQDIQAVVHVRGAEVRTFHINLPSNADARFGTDLPDPSAQCDPTGDRVVDVDVSEWSVPHGHGKYETSRIIRVVSKRLGIDKTIEAADDLACSANPEDPEGLKVRCQSKTEGFARVLDLRIKDGGVSLSSGSEHPCSLGPVVKGEFRLPCGAQVHVRGWRTIW